MDPKLLPFDETAFLTRLGRWVTCESPTYDASRVNAMLDLAARDCAVAGASIERIPGRMDLGGALRVRMPHPLAGSAGILVLGHLDTVHPVGTIEKLAWRRDGDRQYGPGALDMKGGACIAIEALRQLALAGVVTPLPVTILFTGDEEIGTPSTRDLIEAEASRHRFVLVPEPTRPSNNAISGRYAIARFNLLTTGRPSHAGARLSEGRSAVAEMARRVLQINDMTSDDATFSVSVINGGRWVNCVPTTCTAEALSMAKTQRDLDRVVDSVLALAGVENDVTFSISRGVTRPVWEATPATMEMVALAQRLAKNIGFEIGHESAGGGSDGNFTGAMGIPTLDGLGAKGAGAHTMEEHIEIQATIRRGRLFTSLLATLS